MLKTYLTQPYENTHENVIFDQLKVKLEERFSESEDNVALLGNFLCMGYEIDAAVLKKRSLTVIDFKNYGGSVSFSENGPWYAEDQVIKGGSKPNPYLQLKANKFALVDYLKHLGELPSKHLQNYGHISGMVLFHRPVLFEDRHLPASLRPWFFVTDFDHAVEKLRQITSRDLFFSNRDIDFICENLKIPPYTPGQEQQSQPHPVSEESISSKPNLQSPDKKEGIVISHSAFQPSALRISPIVERNSSGYPNQEGFNTVKEFIHSKEQALIIWGTADTDRFSFMEQISSCLASMKTSFTLLAPNLKTAVRLSTNGEIVDSLYSYIFSGNPEDAEKEGQLLYPLAPNQDSLSQVYVIFEAHLVSGSHYETELFKYGSGKLLSDFFEFANVQRTQRKLVFIGDPCQLSRGKAQESALNLEFVKQVFGLRTKMFELQKVKQDTGNVLLQNASVLADNILKQSFNYLDVREGDSDILSIPMEKKELIEVIFANFSSDSVNTKFIAFSNIKVNQFNQWIRKKVFGRTGGVEPGDIMHVRNSFFPDSDQDEFSARIINNSFIEILLVREGPSICQSLKGREKPVEVHFLEIHARVLDGDKNDQTIKFLCFRDYIYSEKPELEKDTILALMVSAEERFKKHIKQNEHFLTEKNKLDEDKLDKVKRAIFLQTDPFLNAAQLRFGYALTLHQAQGNMFHIVIADAETDQGKKNEEYFRWLYTLLTVPAKQLFLWNAPSFDPISSAEWSYGRCKQGNVQTKEVIPYAVIEKNAHQRNTQNIDFPCDELANLYCFINEKISILGAKTDAVDHHDYQEVYKLSNIANDSCKIRFFTTKIIQSQKFRMPVLLMKNCLNKYRECFQSQFRPLQE